MEKLWKSGYEEGYTTIKGAKIYYKLFKAKDEYAKLLCLAGGPGGSHDYILPYANLSQRGITTLFYDQYASGRSEETPDYMSRFTVDYYVDEVETVRDHFWATERVFLVGHSWGAILGYAYALKYQEHLKGLIASSGLTSVKAYLANVNRLRSELPSEVQETLAKAERENDTTSEAYQKAVAEFNRKHVLQVEPWPEEAVLTGKYLFERKPYVAIQGPNEFSVTGTMKNFEITDQLSKIKIPTLITCGRFDEAGPPVAEPIHEKISGSELVVFDKSSHMLMWESQAEDYLNTIESFIKKHSR
ncbi:MAG TPA: proline iminopeptidase-family hydrolase [Nitrososphaerales archaeon]|nr:proline iminopeptidase-family hydrolase [Nitrososphaerales archaeon]